MDEMHRLQAENAALRAEVERMRRRYETPHSVAQPQKRDAAPEPERFALVAPARKPGAPLDFWDHLGSTICQILEKHDPTRGWTYYRDTTEVPEGMTFFDAGEVMRKVWGESPGNPDAPEPRALRRLTASEKAEIDARADAALARSEATLRRAMEALQEK